MYGVCFNFEVLYFLILKINLWVKGQVKAFLIRS